MIRRSPTRIVLKIDDLQVSGTVPCPIQTSFQDLTFFSFFFFFLQEYESMRKEMEAKKGTPAPNSTWENNTKTKQDVVRERIGYVPQPHDS